MNFTVNDLLPICEKCAGEGLVENPILRQNQGGFGRRVISASPVRCDSCNGKGAIPTDFGQTLIEFIQRAKSKGFLSIN